MRTIAVTASQHKPSRAIMDKIPSSLFPPTYQPRAYLGHQETATGAYRTPLSAERAVFSLPETAQQPTSSLDLTRSGERSHLFGQVQKNSEDDCCCAMTPSPIPMHPPDCDECVQSCEDPGCTIELTPQCTDQCVVVCDDTHHGMGSCIEASSGDFSMCLDGTECPAIDDLVCFSHALVSAPFDDVHPSFAAPSIILLMSMESRLS